MSTPERWSEMTREQAIDAAQDAETAQWTQIYLTLAALLPPRSARALWPTWPAPATATTQDIEITEEIEDKAYWEGKCGARYPGRLLRCTLYQGHSHPFGPEGYDHLDARVGDAWKVQP